MNSLTDNPVDIRLLNIKLTSDYSKSVLGILTSIIFSLIFYYINVFIESAFGKLNEQKAHEKFCEKFLAKTGEVDEKKKAKYVRDSAWMIKNLQVSFIHSTLSCCFLTYTFYVRFDMFDDLLVHISNESYLIVAMAIGYFAYDFYDMYQTNKLIEMWLVTAHHIIVISLLSYHLLNLQCLGYSLIAISMEYNSVFLHSRKLLKLYGFKSDHALVAVNHVFNFLTFIVFRFASLGFIYYHIYYYSHRVTYNYFILLLGCAIAMTCLNIGIFYRLVIVDSLKSIKQNKKLKQEDDDVGNKLKHSMSTASLLAEKME